MRRSPAQLACTALAGLLAVSANGGCQRSPAEHTGARADHQTVPRSEIRLPLEATIATLDPAAASDAVSQRVTGQIFDTLLDWDPYASPLTLVPEISELPELDEARTTLRLRLRAPESARRFAPDTCLEGKDAAKQGRLVRASDVAASLLRHADPGIAGAWELLAGRIVGLDAWRDEPVESRPAAPPGIIADDAEGTLTLHLTRAQPELPALLANPRLAIVPPECVAAYDGRDDDHPPFARRPVGSGPYVLDAASELPRAAVLTVNPVAPKAPMPAVSEALPCAHRPGIERVLLEHYASPEAALRLFQAGTIAAIAPGQGLFAEVVHDGALIPGATPADTVLHRSEVLSTTLLVFRMTDPEIGGSQDPTIDRAHRQLRRSIASAFDDRRYHQVIRNGAWATPATQVTHRSLLDPGADVVLHASSAIDRKRPDGSGPRLPLASLRYMTTTGPAAQQEAAILREALRPLGVKLEITYDDAYLYKVLSGEAEPQLFSLRFDADYPDPASFLDPFTCDSPGSYSGFCSPQFDAAHGRFAAAAAGPERDFIAIELERILGREVPVRPIDTPELWLLTRGWLKNVVRHPLSGLRVDLLCIDQAAEVSPSASP